MKNATHHSKVRLLALGATCVLLTACPFDKPEEHLARGREKASQQDHAAAAIEFKNYLQTYPKSAEARFLLGRELLAQGELRTSEIELQKAYDGRYDRDAVVPLLVQTMVLQGQPERIPSAITKLELKKPAANAKLQTLLGMAAMMQGKMDDALTAFRSAQQFQPDYLSARAGEGRVKAMRGNLDEASVIVQAVLAQDPKNIEGLLLKADIARVRAQFKEATATYLAVIALQPRNITARLGAAGTELASNEPDLAAQQVAELKKIVPRDPAVAYFDALVAYIKKDYLRANDAIALSLSENPGSGAARILAGGIALAMKQPAQAEVNLLAGIKQSPDSIFARRMLTSLYLDQNQPQKASEILLPALAAQPDDSVLLEMAGEIAAQRGDFKSASTLFDRAGKIDPNNTDARLRGAVVQLRKGDEAGGFAALEATAKSSGNDARPAIMLVIARLNRRQYDEAMVAWKELEKARPNSPITYNLRAAIDLGRNDRASARTALEHALQLQPTYLPAITNLAELDESDGNLDAARKRYRTLLDKDKDNVAGLLALAQLEDRHGASADVVLPLLLAAHRANPASSQAVTAVVSYYIAHDNLKEGLAVAQDAARSAPDNVTILAMVAELQLRMGGIDQAIAGYRQLVAMQPDVADFQVKLGQALVLGKQPDQAMTMFENALKKHPDDVALQTAAVGSMLRANRPPEATRLVAEIRALSPKSMALAELDGDLKMAARQYADAAALYRKAQAQKASSELVIKQSIAATLNGSPADANALLNDWLKTHPKDLVVRLHQADLAMQAKDYPRAAQGYRAALETKPDNILALNNLAWVLFQQKDPQALTYAEKARGIVPSSPSVNDTLGWILVDQGQTKKGLEYLNQALSAEPGQPSIALHVAKAQIKDGQKDAARKTLQGVLKAAPSSAEAKESKDLMATL
jgi:putative PEP-CTERM system TPR-repeat lipoprotein